MLRLLAVVLQHRRKVVDDIAEGLSYLLIGKLKLAHELLGRAHRGLDTACEVVAHELCRGVVAVVVALRHQPYQTSRLDIGHLVEAKVEHEMHAALTPPWGLPYAHAEALAILLDDEFVVFQAAFNTSLGHLGDYFFGKLFFLFHVHVLHHFVGFCYCFSFSAAKKNKKRAAIVHIKNFLYFCCRKESTLTAMITKDAFLRYRVLDKCFRNRGREYQIDDLIEACNEALAEIYPDKDGVSRRQIYNDIEFMKSVDGWDAPIITVKDGQKRYHRYSDPNFSIDNMPLTEIQLKQIRSAIDMLNNFEGLPQFECIGDSLAKLGLVAMNGDAKPCFSMEYNEFLVGKEYLAPLFNAIQYEKVLEIEYQPYNEEKVRHIFHPQFLKQYNNRWYVFGMSEDAPKQIWNLALDRIKSIKTTDAPYKKLDLDWKEFFDDIIGVTNKVEDPVEEVHFLVHGKTAHYLLSKPIHGSQRSHWIDDNTLDIKLNVKINYELKRTLLSYAADITILGPEALVREHKETLKRALKQY